MPVTWSNLFPLTQEILDVLPDGAGVYRLSYRASDGAYYVFYVGKSDSSVKDRLSDHIAPAEMNMCIKSHVSNLECFFRYALIPSGTERQQEERTAILQFKPKCNSLLP